MVVLLLQVSCEMPGEHLFTELILEIQWKKLHQGKRPKPCGEQGTDYRLLV